VVIILSVSRGSVEELGTDGKVECGVEIRKAGLRKILAPGDTPQGDSAGEDEKRELLWIC
jgi:hypothetical protein